MTIVITLLAFGVIIAVHEFGHFIGAKLAGIRVLEYSLGLGPTIARFIRGETTYSLRLLLPLGGFVRMAGADPTDPVEAADERSFLAQPVYRRAGVILAGPIMNFVLAIILFSVVYGGIGILRPEPVISEVVPDMPAAAAGMRVGDRIVSVDGRPVIDWARFVQRVQAAGDRSLTVVVEREGTRRELEMTPEVTQEGRGMIGVLPQLVRQRFGVLAALGRGFSDTFTTTVVWIRSFVLMVTGQAPGDVAGPIGIAQMIGWAASIGADTVLLIVALISVNVGLINLLPIPVLDGSRLLFLAVEGVRGRPIDPRYEQALHLVGFAFLMVLVVLLTYRDLVRLITQGGSM